jgi:integrase
MPKRGNHEGSIRQRPNGLWEARLSLPNGRRKSLYGETRKDVQDKLRHAQRDMESGLDLTAKTRTVEHFLTDWMATVGPSLSPKTHDSYAQVIRLYLIPALGRYRLDKLTPAHVQKMMADLGQRQTTPQTITYQRGATTVSYTRTGGSLSARTITYARDVLRIALNQAVAWGLVTRNVAALTKPPRADRTPVQPLTAKQARAFLDYVEHQQSPLFPLITTAIQTGMRQAELLGLRWRDVDLSQQTIHVRHTLQRVKGEWQFREPKSKRSVRTLAIPDPLLGVLRAHKDRQAFEQRTAANLWHDMDLVFTTALGTPLEPSNINRRLHRFLDACTLPRQGMHSLRHCCASLMLAQGIPARIVMEQLGHSQISLTMDTYAHVMPTMLKEAAKSVSAALSEAASGTD